MEIKVTGSNTTVNIYLGGASKRLKKQLNRIEQRLDSITKKEKQTMAMIDDLKAAVQDEQTKIDAVKTYLDDVVAKLANEPTPEEVAAVVADIQAHSAELAGMVPTPVATA